MSLEKIQMDKENVEKRKSFPDFKSGDTINVHVKIREGNKERIQQFQGTVIQRRNITILNLIFSTPPKLIVEIYLTFFLKLVLL